MKIDQLIVRYLYNNKKVSLQDIGTFTVSPEINIPTENDKDTVLPPDAIQFVCDRKALPDEGLINYIVEHTRKIKPLATSDLESFIMLNTQFLNIGKPLILEGIGTLQKTQVGDYAFTQAGTSHLIYEEAPKIVTEKQKEKVSFATPPREKNTGGGKAAAVVLILLLLGAAGFAAYYFMYMRNNDASNAIAATGDTTSIITQDTTPAKPIESPAVLPAIPADSNTFYIVIKEYNSLAAAQKSLERLKGYGNTVMLTTKDSLLFKVRAPFTRSLADTLRVRDSLSKFFGAATYVELP